MRRDRDGSPLEELDEDDLAELGLDPADALHVCVDGWLGFDDDGRPTPCLDCRPHLARRHLSHAR